MINSECLSADNNPLRQAFEDRESGPQKTIEHTGIATFSIHTVPQSALQQLFLANSLYAVARPA
jgi:hypothetical protein